MLKRVRIGRKLISKTTVTTVGVLVVAALLGCAPENSGDPPPTATQSPAASPNSTPETPEGEPAKFLSVTDGDTIETSEGTVRIIGIDTPERRQCGYDEASAAIAALVTEGDTVYLELPAGQNDQDRYGRLLRYVATEQGVDLGLSQVKQGHAVARYDSRDGYPAHPREDAYAAVQTAELTPDRRVITAACVSGATAMPVEPERTTTPAPVSEPATGDTWWLQYGSCSRLKKNTAGHQTGPFNVNDPAHAEIYEWFAYGTGHNGDGDGDGLACE